MGSVVAEAQAADVQAPRRGAIIALDVDATARAYSLASLDLAGVTPEGAATRRHEVFLTVQAITTDIYFYLSDGSSTAIDDTAQVAAGGTLAYANTYGWRVPADTEQSFRIDRSRDTHLVCKTAAGTSVLLLRASSEST